MKRVVQIFSALCLAVGAWAAGPAAAWANDSFTVDDIPGGIIAEQPNHDEVKFSGTVTYGGEEMDVFIFIDSHLVTCEDDFGNDFNEYTCLRTGWFPTNTTWEYFLTHEDVERLGLTFLGPHEVRFVLTRWMDGPRFIQDEKTLSLEFVTEMPTETPTSLPQAALPLAPEPQSPRSSVSELSSGDPASPSVLSAVRPLATVATSHVNAVITAAVTIILLLLVGFPSALLGQSLGENYDRLFGRVNAAVRRAKTKLSRPAVPHPPLPEWLPITFGLVLATIMSAFVDPGFGFNPGSARMLASMGIAFALESVAGWVVIRAVLARTDPELRPKPEFKFGSLLIILIAVILSRLVGFEPGMVFGLVVGLAFGTSLASAREVRVKFIGLTWAFTIGVVGWVGYSLLAGASGWLPLFAAETLSAVAVGSLAALPVALLPLGGLDGGVLFRWNRWAWAGVYAVALFVFFVVLLPMPFSWGEIGAPLATWVALYVAYAVFAVAVWAGFRLTKPKGAHPKPSELETAGTLTE